MYKYLYLVLISIVSNNQIIAQEYEDELYLLFDNKNVQISESKVSDNLEIYLYYNIFSESDIKSTTYVFKVDNISEKFEFLKFDQINDIIKSIDSNKLLTFSLLDLEKIDHCELHMRISNADKIYLIKQVGEEYLKYKLKYWSTRRGWEVNTD